METTLRHAPARTAQATLATGTETTQWIDLASAFAEKCTRDIPARDPNQQAALGAREITRQCMMNRAAEQQKYNEARNH